jgi:hypothetical protein
VSTAEKERLGHQNVETSSCVATEAKTLLTAEKDLLDQNVGTNSCVKTEAKILCCN